MKTRKLLSLLLAAVIFVTGALSAMTTTGATLLNLKTVRATLDLTGYTTDELKNMPLKTVLDKIECDYGAYTLGESIDSNPNAKIVWTKYRDENGNTVYDEYHVEDLTATVDMTGFYSSSTYYSIEVIVGSGNQLDPSNVCYDVSVTLADMRKTFTISDAELYFQASNGNRTEASARFSSSSTSSTYINSSGERFSIRDCYVECYDKLNDNDCYIALNFVPNNASYSFKVYSDTERTEEITDKLCGDYWSMETTNAGVNVGTSYNSYWLVDVYDGEKVIYSEAVHLDFSEYNLSVPVIYRLNDTNGKDAYSGLSTYKYTDDDKYKAYKLYSGYSANATYVIKTYYVPSEIECIVVGKYETAEEVLAQPNIKSAIENGTYSGVFAEPTTFTLYGTETVGGKTYEYIDYWTFCVVESDEDKTPTTTTTNSNIPYTGRDPYFYLTNVKNADNTYTNNFLALNTTSKPYDTYYAYGYQTAFVSDDVDMSNIILTVAGDERDNVYDAVHSQKIDFSQPQNLSSGMVQYTVSTGNKIRNYFVSVQKKQTGGAKLYVNGPSDRTVNLDDYFDNRHDILIANVGDQPLTGLNVEWSVAPVNVKLHDYWTVGGENNDTLAPLDDASVTDYLAKIRLVPDGEGDISGQLKISADGQEPVYINISGHAGNPKIVTESPLKNAVKYVPYSAIVATDNIYDWAYPSFTCSGTLPDGVTFNKKTGEIYGVPTETGKFNFNVTVHFVDENGSSLDFPYVSKEFELEVLDNTNENVYNATDEDYTIKTPIGTEANAGQHDYYLTLDGADKVFASNGEFGEFIDLWLNGEKLTEGTDYTKAEGSTIITIKSQTLGTLEKDSSNTIAAEFRVGGNLDNELKRTAQNFTIGEISNTTPSNPSTPSTPSTPTTPSTPSTSNKTDDSDKKDSAVEKAEKLIDEISDKVTADDKDDIEAARDAYDKLTDDQKKQVENIDKLIKAEETLADLEAEEEDDVEVDDDVEADDIDDSDSEVDSDSDEAEEAVSFAGAIYNKNGAALSDISLELHSKVQKTTTNSNGAFSFSAVELGKHTLTATDKSGNTAKKEFTIVSGDKFNVADDVITVSADNKVDVNIIFDGNTISFVKSGEELPTTTVVVGGGDSNPTTGVAFPLTAAIAAGCLACVSVRLKKRK